MSRFRLAYAPYEVRFKRPLVTGSAVYTHRRGWWVAVRDEAGSLGFGEVAPLPGFGGEAYEMAASTFAKLAECPLSLTEPSLEGVAAALKEAGLTLAHTPCVHAGVELALLDALTKRDGHALAQAFSRTPAPEAELQRLLTSTDPEGAIAEGERAIAEGFKTFKLKVGAAPLATDLARVSALRARFPAIRLRLDANGAWQEAEAITAIEAFAPLGIDLLEQPVAGADFAALRHRGVPIAADEALLDAETAHRLIAEQAVDALVLKPMLLGGLGVAHALAQEAQRQGLRTVVTSSLDRLVGVAAALHLACALDGPEPAGLSTLALLDAPDADGPLRLRKGALVRPEGPGLGVCPPEPAHTALTRSLERC
ncbi:o-succinylbenzoate synthase [bacterium]|nr:o-succinylbenzoate synthase [bacterium]